MQTKSSCEKPLSARARSILEAARICFERYGFHAASMARIADEADISVGHIYRYFANKEAVVFAIIGQDIDEVSHDLERLNGSPEELADHFLNTFQSSRSRQKTILRLEVMAEGARNPKAAAMLKDMERWIRERVKVAIANAVAKQELNGPLDHAEMETRISFIGLLMEGLQLRAFQEGEELPSGLLDQVRRLLVEIFTATPIGTDAAHAPPARLNPERRRR